ncbi:hypothetical protein Tco_1116341 [Tanacetum coccineum]
MSKGISLTFSISTRHTNKKLAQTRLHHRHNTHNLRRHSNNIPVLGQTPGENEADHIEAANITFAAQQPKGRKFQLEHSCHILKGHSKWDASKPFDAEDHIEIFGPDTKPRPAGKTRPAKKTKSETTGSSGGSASGSISDFVSEDLRRKLQA